MLYKSVYWKQRAEMISLVTSLSVTTVHMAMETCNYKSDSFSYCGVFSIGWVSEFLLLMWVGLFLTILVFSDVILRHWVSSSWYLKGLYCLQSCGSSWLAQPCNVTFQKTNPWLRHGETLEAWRFILLCHNMWSGSGVFSALYPVVTEGSCPGSETSRDESGHSSRFISGLKICGTISAFSSYVLMGWRLMKHRDCVLS